VIAFFLFRFVMLGLFILGAIIWTVSANWHAIPRWLLRVLFFGALLTALGILIVLSLGDQP
jgi:hypothetical protein